jgi:hypothetical protein
MTAAVAHYYKHFRGNMDRPAAAALASARSFVHFRKRLSGYVAKGRKSPARKRAN